MGHIRGVDDFTAEKLNYLAGGIAVSDDVLGVVKRLQEYDENIVVQFADPAKCDITDAPYRIMELCPDGMLRVIMEVWKLDNTVLERLYALDTQKWDVLQRIDKANQAVTLGEKRRYQDEVRALSEMAGDVLKSPKDTYTATNPVTGQSHKFTSLRRE